MKKCVALTLLLASSAHATVTIPYTFSSGSGISASEMNQNFTALKTAVDALVSGVSGVSSVSGSYPIAISGSAGTPVVGLNFDTNQFVIDGSNQLALKPSGVDTSAILDGTITNADIAVGANIAWNKIDKTGAMAADVNAFGPADVGTSANKLVQLDGSARLPPVDGSLLTNMPVSPWTANGNGATFSSGGIGVGTSAATNYLIKAQGNLTSTSGTDYGLSLTPILNQTAGASSNIIYVNTTETSLGSGSHNLMSLNVASSPKFVVTHLGDVGVGTNTPNAPLEITKTSTSLLNMLSLRNATGPTVGYGSALSFMISSATPLAQIVSRVESGTNGDLGFYTFVSGSPNERIRVKSNGFVGIGTITPAYTLHVQGDIAYTGTTLNVSDRRLKKDIRTIPHALESLLSLRGVSYAWKNSKQSRKLRHMGVIAQEVEKVFPEAVSTDNKGFKSVSYPFLIAPLINAVKELHTGLEDLREENHMLKSYICRKDPRAPFCH